MSYTFTGINSYGQSRKISAVNSSVSNTNSSVAHTNSSVAHTNSSEAHTNSSVAHTNSSVLNTIRDTDSSISSIIEDDIVSDDVASNEDNDDDNSVTDDNVSAITTASKKKLDVDIQREVWDIGLEQLYEYDCPCKRECTLKVPVGHVVNTRRTSYGPGAVTALMRRKSIFTMLTSANRINSQFR